MKPDDKARRDEFLQMQRDKHAAYVELFGKANQPTTAAAIVLADFERFARFRHSPNYRPKIGKQPGPLDPYGTVYNVALQDFVKRIYQWLSWSDADGRDSNDSFDGE